MYKATIQIGDKSITFEGPREFVEEQVAKYTKPLASKQQALMHRKEQARLPAEAPDQAFVESKRPQSHAEIIAVLAFYLAENGLPEFTEDDMRRAYIRAVIRPPRVVSQAIRDAKNRYGYVQRGSKRGTYQLSPHGDRTVRFDLPRQ